MKVVFVVVEEYTGKFLGVYGTESEALKDFKEADDIAILEHKITNGQWYQYKIFHERTNSDFYWTLPFQITNKEELEEAEHLINKATCRNMKISKAEFIKEVSR